MVWPATLDNGEDFALQCLIGCIGLDGLTQYGVWHLVSNLSFDVYGFHTTSMCNYTARAESNPWHMSQRGNYQ